ncbi:unnamed protein product [Lupinus luteus]|uniref:Reverse transcriptase zinc-binding domain-containing protein n=1 Tax=Lupinus luteus TaxID=3873 RepID=A0AAV1XBA4_LUPLU
MGNGLSSCLKKQLLKSPYKLRIQEQLGEYPNDFPKARRAISLVDSNGMWNLSLLSEVVLRAILNKIVALQPPCVDNPDDSMAWAGSNDGIFSVSYAYYITVVQGNYQSYFWAEAIWNWKGPYRISIFVWRLLNNGLPTNSQRYMRSLSDSTACVRCQKIESVEHVLRNCPWVKDVWRRLRNLVSDDGFFSQDFGSWCVGNLEDGGDE